MGTESDRELFERAVVPEGGQFELIGPGDVLSLLLQVHEPAGPIYFEVWYEHEQFEFRSPGRKDAVAHGLARLIGDKELKPVRIFFSKWHKTATLKGLALEGHIRTLDWLPSADKAQEMPILLSEPVAPERQDAIGSRKVLPLTKWERIQYGSAGLLLIALGAWSALEFQSNLYESGYQLVPGLVAIAGIWAVTFAIVGRQQVHRGEQDKEAALAAKQQAARDEIADLIDMPWYVRYPIAALVLGAAIWLISANPDLASWKLWCIGIFAVLGSAGLAYELGCLLAFFGLMWGVSVLGGVAFHALPESGQSFISKGVPWAVAVFAGYHLLRLHEANEALQRRVNDLEASRQAQRERLANLEEYQARQRNRGWAAGSDPY